MHGPGIKQTPHPKKTTAKRKAHPADGQKEKEPNVLISQSAWGAK